MVPPLIECKGVRIASAKAVVGIYEFRGINNGRAAYRQIGVSSGNYVWFAEECVEGPHWVITQKAREPGRAPEEVIARSSSLARWPWEVDAWTVCNNKKMFQAASTMCFELLMPAAELLVQMPSPLGGGGVAVDRYHGAGHVHGKPAFQRIGNSDSSTSVRMFFMPIQKRWMIASVDNNGGGVQTLHARSMPDDNVTWAHLWPWAMETGSWETPSTRTAGLDDGDAIWTIDHSIQIRLSSPDVRLSGSLLFNGLYEARGMAHGRVYYLQVHEDSKIEVAGPQCLWYAEDRGQWVITGPHQVGDSTVVRARIQSRAWWPWEAHLGGCTSPAVLGSAPFAAAPPWQGGAAMLASSCTPWEELAEIDGKMQVSKTMKVEAIFARGLYVRSHASAKHAFLGEYKYAGLLTSRPFFVQVSYGRRNRSVLWYAEECDHWVITADFRLLDCLSADARCADTAWFPWEASVNWEVADGVGGFCTDPHLLVEANDVPWDEADDDLSTAFLLAGDEESEAGSAPVEAVEDGLPPAELGDT